MLYPTHIFLQKFRFDTAENEPAKNLQNFANLKSNFPNFPNFANSQVTAEVKHHLSSELGRGGAFRRPPPSTAADPAWVRPQRAGCELEEDDRRSLLKGKIKK